MDRLLTFQFAQPWWLLLLLLVPLRFWLGGKAGRSAGLPFSSVSLVRNIGIATRSNPGRWHRVLENVAFALLIVALAWPRMERGTSNDKKEGIDIVFAVDTSGSMGAGIPYRGGKISKSDALTQAVCEFVDIRPNDRFGMIGFAYDSWLMSPLTLDGSWIKSVLQDRKKYQHGVTGSGTAVGNGILSALELMKNATGKSKIIVLATDGESNAGIAPMEAAEQARKAKVRVYTFGMGTGGAASQMLKQIADTTGGMFFGIAGSRGIRDSTAEMREACRQIDQLERSKIEQKKFRVYAELYPTFVLTAFALLLIDLVSRHTLWMRIP